MIKIYNLNNYIKREMAYGGHDCSKKAIIFNNENWFIKYPRINHQSSVEEYLGSMIYQKMGLLTQEVKLGIINNILVVICKDFLANNEIILDYNCIRNSHSDEIEKYFLSKSLASSINDLEQIMVYMDKNEYFKELPDQYEGIKIISDISKDFYLQMLKYRYEKVLLPAYNNLIK